MERYTSDGMILLLGKKEWPTLLPWPALEDLPDFLRGRGWVLIGSVYSSESQLGSLYYSPGLLHGVLLSVVCGLRGVGSCFEAGVVMVPAGACLVAASPS